MTKISIIILNWNGSKDTVDCLKSLENLKSEEYKFDVIVVDNASNDDSVSKIEKYLKTSYVKKGIKVEVIQNKTNLGFAAGNNAGIDHAENHNSDYLLILNNDTIVEKNLLKDLLETATKHPKAGMISPKIYFAKGFEYYKKRYKKTDLGKVIWYAGGKMDWDNIYGSNRGVDEVDKGQYDEVEETDFATGACVLMNSLAIRNIGKFDASYFMYLEDADLSQRMKKGGWKVLYSPRAHLWHKVARSSGIGSDLNDYFTTRNRLMFGMRYASVRTRFALYRESIKMLMNGRLWQKKGVVDFYTFRLGKGSWKN